MEPSNAVFLIFNLSYFSIYIQLNTFVRPMISLKSCNRRNDDKQRARTKQEQELQAEKMESQQESKWQPKWKSKWHRNKEELVKPTFQTLANSNPQVEVSKA